MTDTAVKVLVLRNKNTQMLLVLEKGNSIRPSGWGLPGGCSETSDRTIYDVGFRETKEETGAEIVFDFNVQPFWQEFDGYKKAFLLAYYAGGELLGETEETLCSSWVPVDVLYNEQLRREFCPEGIYSSHIWAVKELLSRLQSEKTRKEAALTAPTLSSEHSTEHSAEHSAQNDDNAPTVFPAASFSPRRLTDEEVPRAVRERWRLGLRLGGKIYKGRITFDKYGLVFDGNCSLDHIRTMGGKVSPQELLVL